MFDGIGQDSTRPSASTNHNLDPHETEDATTSRGYGNHGERNPANNRKPSLNRDHLFAAETISPSADLEGRDDIKRIFYGTPTAKSSAPLPPLCVFKYGNAEITQAIWDQYTANAANYIRKWYSFQAEILGYYFAQELGIDHFRSHVLQPFSAEESWNSGYQRHQDYIERHLRLLERLSNGGSPI